MCVCDNLSIWSCNVLHKQIARLSFAAQEKDQLFFSEHSLPILRGGFAREEITSSLARNKAIYGVYSHFLVCRQIVLFKNSIVFSIFFYIKGLDLDFPLIANYLLYISTNV